MITGDYNWELRSRDDDRLIARLPLKGIEYPWVICRFEPTTEFKSYRHLFMRLNLPIETDEDDPGESIHEQINRHLKLVTIRGEWPEITEFLMFIKEREVHFQVIFAS